MKTITVWPGAVVGVGDAIEIRVLCNSAGTLKLAIAAPEDLRIARRGGSRPPNLRRLRHAARHGARHKN